MVEPLMVAVAELHSPLSVTAPLLATLALPAADTPVTSTAPLLTNARSPLLVPLKLATWLGPVRLVEPVDEVMSEAAWIEPDSVMLPTLVMRAAPDAAMRAISRLRLLTKVMLPLVLVPSNIATWFGPV